MSDELSPGPSVPSTPRRSRRSFLLPSRARHARNMAIFRKVEVEGLTHEEVAQSFNIDRSRVTRIVARLCVELAQASASDAQIQDPLARQRLDRALEKIRLEYALGAAVNTIRQQPPNLVTMRHGSYGRGENRQEWNETVRRGLPPNMQAIKTFVRVTRDLGELNRREIAENPLDARLSAIPFFQSLAAALSEWSAHVRDKPNPPNDAFLANVRAFERDLRYFVHNLQYGVPAAHAWPEQAFEEWRRKMEEETQADQQDCLDQPDASRSHDPANDYHQNTPEGHQTRTMIQTNGDATSDDMLTS